VRITAIATGLTLALLVLAPPASAANTYAGSDWILETDMNGQIELSAGFIDFASGQVSTAVTAYDIPGGAKFSMLMPIPLSLELYEVDWNGNWVLGDVGDRLLRVYGDDPGETPIVIDGSALAWMNPVLADYDLQIQLLRVSTTIMAKNGNRVYQLRDGKGFILEGMAWAKPGTGRENGYLAASSKFFLTRPVPEPHAIAGVALGFAAVLGARARRRA